MPRHQTLRVPFVAMLVAAIGSGAVAAEDVAQIFGRSVTSEELVSSVSREAQKAKLSPEAYATWLQQQRQEKLRALVWQAVFEEYTKQRHIEPSDSEVDSYLQRHRRFMQEDKARRAKDIVRLTEELKSPNLNAAQRKQSQDYLATLKSLEAHDARMDAERRDPQQQKIWLDSERRVSRVWITNWKVNRALYREYGGRIIFQQAGWEPIDAYRKLLEQSESRKAFVVKDAALHDAVYSYFKYNFVYGDENKAKFYFEKPYWERTPAEMKAAGF